MSRRRRRRRQKPYRNANLKNRILSVAMVMCISVAAGYMTATYLLGPALGIETEPSFLESIKKEQKQETEDEVTEEKVIENKTVTESESGFALQYGSFSSKEGANECVEDLKASGIDAEIIEQDGMFKVIGKLFDTKDEARDYMEKNSQDVDVFITEIP